MSKYLLMLLLLPVLLTVRVFANTAPTAPTQLAVLPAPLYPAQTILMSWVAGSGHMAGVSDFGVYLLPVSGGQRLVYGPVSWQAAKSNYQVNFKSETSPGLYKYRVYACNHSNYCSFSDINVQVSVPSSPQAPQNLTLVSTLPLGQSATLSWTAGTGHIAAASAFGVYVTPPSGQERLLHGPVNWVANQSSYQLVLKPNHGAGEYIYRVYACNFSNYCRSAEKRLLVTSNDASYTVTAIAGAGGSISPTSRVVSKGSTTTFSLTPQTGFSLNAVSGCQGTRTGLSYQTGAILANCTVSASFTSSQSFHQVSTSMNGSGSITPTSALVADGASQVFSLAPQTGYQLTSATGCGGTLSGRNFTTAPVRAPCTVTVVFGTASDAVSYLHTDVLGSVVAETDVSGNLKNTTEYKPFGETKEN